jgi:hypothetical protein
MCSPRAVGHIPSTNTLALMERAVCMYIYMYDLQCVLTLEKWACIYMYVHTLGSIYKMQDEYSCRENDIIQRKMIDLGWKYLKQKHAQKKREKRD